MDNYIQISGRNYAIDLEKLMKFVCNDSSVVTTINQSYGNEPDSGLSLATKDVTETKEAVSEIMSNYRYNIITNMLNLLLIPTADGNGDIILIEDINHMHFGQKLAFNTLVEMEIIYEIEETEE